MRPHRQHTASHVAIRVLFKCVSFPFPTRLWALAALSAWIIESTLIHLGTNSYLRNDALSWKTKFAFVGLPLMIWISIAWVAFWCVRILAHITCTYPLLVRLLLGVSAACISATGVAIYFASWSFHTRLGVFLDPDALHFGALNGYMLLHYFWQAERHLVWLSLAVLALIVIATTSWMYLAMRLSISQRRTHTVSSLPGLLVLTATANLTLLSFALTDHPSVSSQYHSRIDAALAPHPTSRFELTYHVTPFIAFAAPLCVHTCSHSTDEIPLDCLTPSAPLHLPSSTNIRATHTNVILIVIESLRSDAILAQHQQRQVMPHVSQSAHNGTFYPNCYSNSTHSDYSDPSIVSSLYPLRTSRPHYYSASDPWPKVLLYDILKQHGYATAIISSQNETWSNMHLFYASPHLDLLFDARSHTDASTFGDAYISYWMAKTGQVAGKLDDALTIRRAIDWIHQQGASRVPFFVAINLQTSHFPYERPDGQSGPFAPSAIDLPVSLLHFPPEAVPALRNSYYNALSYVDEQIGRLLECLRRSGLDSTTAIVITGDHGEAFSESGVPGHAGPPLETTTKVGLVINWPGLSDAGVDEYLVQSIDLAPTLVALLGMSRCDAFQGINITSPTRPPQAERLLFIHSNNAAASYDAVVSGTGWKYIYDVRESTACLYYRPTDLEVHECRREREPEVTSILERARAEWRRRQLCYYSSPRYYEWFWPPASPFLTRTQLMTLEGRAKVAE